MRSIFLSLALMMVGLALLSVGTIFQMEAWLQAILYLGGFGLLGGGFWVMRPSETSRETS